MLNEENEMECRNEEPEKIRNSVDQIRKDEVRKVLKRMKSGKSVGPDDIPVEVSLGEVAVDFLNRLFNRILCTDEMPDEWRKSVLVPIYRKGNVQSCNNYRGMKLMSHTRKFWEKVVEAGWQVGRKWRFVNNSMVSCLERAPQMQYLF